MFPFEDVIMGMFQMEFNNVEHSQEEAVDIAPKDGLDTAPNADIDDTNDI